MPVLQLPVAQRLNGTAITVKRVVVDAPALLWAVVADVAVAGFLTWGFIAAPGGVGVLQSDSVLRLLLLRVAAVLIVALSGTWLICSDARLGGVFLIGAAVGSAVFLPSPFWVGPAALLGVAGALGVTNGWTASSVQVARVARAGGTEPLGLVFLVLAALAFTPSLVASGFAPPGDVQWPSVGVMLLPAGVVSLILGAALVNAIDARRVGLAVWIATLILGVALTVVGAPGGLASVYAALPGARPANRAGDVPIPVPPPEPEYSLTPVPVRSSLALSADRVRLGVGESTTIALSLRSDMPVDAIGFDLSFDPSVIAVDDVAVGPDLQTWADQHAFAAISIPGVVEPSARDAGIHNAGVGLIVSAQTNAVGPTSGKSAVLTVRAQNAGQTRLAVAATTLYSWIDGRHRHHAAPDPPAAPLEIVVE